jgi:glutaredoxin-like protein NrdH
LWFCSPHRGKSFCEIDYVGGELETKILKEEIMFEHEVRNRIPILFAISTCPRCSRMKRFLREHKVEAKIVDYDLLPRSEKKAHLTFLQPINPRLSFPTLVVGDMAVIGENYDEVREVLGL